MNHMIDLGPDVGLVVLVCGYCGVAVGVWVAVMVV